MKIVNTLIEIEQYLESLGLRRNYKLPVSGTHYEVIGLIEFSRSGQPGSISYHVPYLRNYTGKLHHLGINGLVDKPLDIFIKDRADRDPSEIVADLAEQLTALDAPYRVERYLDWRHEVGSIDTLNAGKVGVDKSLILVKGVFAAMSEYIALYLLQRQLKKTYAWRSLCALSLDDYIESVEIGYSDKQAIIRITVEPGCMVSFYLGSSSEERVKIWTDLIVLMSSFRGPYQMRAVSRHKDPPFGDWQTVYAANDYIVVNDESHAYKFSISGN